MCYWLVDVKKLFFNGSTFFIIVGMNSIFIYLFMNVGGAGVLHKNVYSLYECIVFVGRRGHGGNSDKLRGMGLVVVYMLLAV